MSMGKHDTHKIPGQMGYSKEWSGVSFAPHCKGKCPDCGTKLHHEGGSHYCPMCDDYKARPDGCDYD